MKILLIEDDESCRTMLVKVLGQAGHEVTACDSGEKGWAACQSDRFGLIVLDWMLPGMHGIELCRRIRAQPHGDECVILMLTARQEPDDLQTVLNAGASDYFVKPIDWPRLKIRLAVAERQFEVIAQRKQAEEALRETLHRFQIIADNVSDMIYTAEFPGAADAAAPSAETDPPAQVRVTFISPAVERVLGYTPDQIKQKSIASLLTPESYRRALTAIAEAFCEDLNFADPSRRRTLELEHVCKSGAVRWCEVTSTFLRDANGRPTGVVGVSRDITERRLAEQAIAAEQLLLKQMLDFHERERKLIAYDIHDALAQQIASSLMHLEGSEETRGSHPEGSTRLFHRGLGLLREAMDEARRLISGLRPPILDESGIVAAIEYLVNEARSSLAEVELMSLTDFERLPPPLENAVFRIVQEALSNAIRHSQALRVRVEFAQHAHGISIEVRDWGIGFDPRKDNEEQFGLRGIRERARLMGGKATVSSSPGAGCSILAEFPLPPTV